MYTQFSQSGQDMPQSLQRAVRNPLCEWYVDIIVVLLIIKKTVNWKIFHSEIFRVIHFQVEKCSDAHYLIYCILY